jgi:serine/threonine protein kinase
VHCRFALGRVIGSGAYGIVRIGKSTVTDELVAVKMVDGSQFRSIGEIEQMQEEMNVLSSLKHPNIIRLLEVHFTNNVFFLVMVRREDGVGGGMWLGGSGMMMTVIVMMIIMMMVSRH